MAHYPVFLDLRGRECLVVGGGDVAERKVRALLRAEARVRVVAPAVTPGLAALADRGSVAVERRRYRAGDLDGVRLAIAATDDPAVQGEVAADAERRGVLVNVVDEPELCGFIAPAVVERGDVQVAVSTGGAAPVLAARIRDRVAAAVGPEYGATARILGEIRRRLRAERRPAAERRRIVVALAASELPELLRGADRHAIDRLLSDVVGPGVTLAALGVEVGGESEAAPAEP